MDPKDLEREMQLRQQYNLLEAQWDTLMKGFRLQAQAQKAYFDCLVEEGFAIEQALVLTAQWHPLRTHQQ